MKEKSLSEKQIITINKIMIASSKGDLDEVGRLFFEIQENDAEAVRRLKDKIEKPILTLTDNCKFCKANLKTLRKFKLGKIIDKIFGDFK